MVTIAVTNQKGGCGKTTSVRNIGSVLNVPYRKKVLLVDLDPSINLTSFFKQAVGAEEDFTNTLYDCMQDGVNPQDAVRSFTFTRGPRSTYYTRMTCSDSSQDIPFPDHVKLDHVRETKLALIPGDRKFTGLDIKDPEWLRTFLSDSYFEQFDYCLLDCPPQTVSTTAFSILAADYALIPADTSPDSVEGAIDEWNHITEAQESGVGISVIGMFFTKVVRVSAARALVDNMAESLKDTGVLMNSRIRNSDAATLNCRMLGTVPTVYDLLGDYTKDYIDLTTEMLTRLDDPAVRDRTMKVTHKSRKGDQ